MNNQRMIMPSGGLKTQHITVNGKSKQEIESSEPKIVETFKFYEFFTAFKQYETVVVTRNEALVALGTAATIGGLITSFILKLLP